MSAVQTLRAWRAKGEYEYSVIANASFLAKWLVQNKDKTEL